MKGLLWLIALLAGSHTVSAQITESEPNDNASQANLITRGTVPWSDTGSLVLNPTGDKDWFTIHLEAGEKISVTTTPTGDGANTTPDTVAALIDPSGTTVLMSNDDSGPGRGSAFDYVVSSSGDYYIAVTGFSTLTGQNTVAYYTGSHVRSGPYTLDVTVDTAPQPFETEPNNNAAQATPITRGSSPWIFTGEASFSPPGDNDWFRIHLNANEVLQVTTTPLGNDEHSSPDTVMALIDPTASTVLVYNDDNNSNSGSSFTYQSCADQDVYIAITGFHGLPGQNTVAYYTGAHSISGPYRVDISIIVNGLPTVFTLTEGNARALVNGINDPLNRTGSGAGVGTLIAIANGPDHLYQNWWWYRVDSSSREYALSNLTAYSGPTPCVPSRTSTLTYDEPEGLRFTLTYTLNDEGFNQTRLDMDFTVTNTSSATQTVHFFHYCDIDLNGSGTPTNDLAELTYPNMITVTDAATPNLFLQIASRTFPDAWEIQPFEILLNRLTDESTDTLANTGSPFGPNDFTSAYQYVYTLDPNQSASGKITLAINIDLSVPGDVNGDGCVDDTDLSAVIFEFGGPETGSFGKTDLNDDGIVDDADLAEVIFNFGNGCQ